MADQNINNMTVTWNSGGTTFDFMKANVTDTASAVASLLQNFQVGGVAKWTVKKDGSFTAAGNGTITGTLGVTGHSTFTTLSIPVGSAALPSLYVAGDRNTGFFQSVADTLQITTGGTQAASFNSAGDITAAGDVHASASFIGSANVVLATTGAGIVFLSPNGEASSSGRASLASSGDLNVNGDVTASSDIKLKKHIKRIKDALSKVRRMRGVYYTLKRTNAKHVGVVAQEIESIVPEVVSDNDGTKAVAYGNLVAVLIEAVKELADKVEALESK